VKKLKITLRKSPIGYGAPQRATLTALGLRRLNQTVERPDNDSVRGMVSKVVHLVECEEVSSKSK
jgi:large subunit ribosomal protein L30